MLDKVVFHIKFGVGNVMNQTPDTITVNFQDFGIKTFVYPDSFTTFLKFTDPILQKHVEKIISQKNNISNALVADYHNHINQLIQETELQKQKLKIQKALNSSLKKYLEKQGLYVQFKLAKSVLAKNKQSSILLKANIVNNPEILNCLYLISENSNSIEILKAFEEYIPTIIYPAKQEEYELAA